MKKKIVVQNASQSAPQKGEPADRKERLAKELRDNLHKRKAQARKQRGKDNNG